MKIGSDPNLQSRKLIELVNHSLRARIVNDFGVAVTPSHGLSVPMGTLSPTRKFGTLSRISDLSDVFDSSHSATTLILPGTPCEAGAGLIHLGALQYTPEN